MKFRNYIAFYRNVNKWIRDGWNLVQSYHTNSLLQLFFEKDGVKESLVLFYSEDLYDLSSQLIAAAEQKDKTMAQLIALKSNTPNWADFGAFKGGAVVMYEGQKYLCLAPHKRLENKPPHMHPAWAIVHVSKNV